MIFAVHSNMISSYNAYSTSQKLFRLALVYQCVHGHVPAYLAECYETNKQYGHCTTHGVNKLHLKSVNTEFDTTV